MKIIIIGGVAGGATTAARIRRTNETAEIILLEKGKYISYANCGLPYYIGGVIEEREKLFVQTPEAFSTRFRVDVRTENEVIFIDRKRKTVTVRQSSEDSYEESYDKLLISTGASPVRPPLPGIDLNGIFTLRNVTDTDRIKEYINSHAPRKAVVIGAGFIGLEMAENLHAQGAKVSIVEMGNQVMAPIDFSMASLVHQHLMDKGVNLYLEQAVASFERDGKELKVIFKNGESISADIVILSIGVRPETTLARAAELTIGEAGGIAVNDYLQTSDESIYAIGDAIEFRHPITGKPWLNYLAGPANRQGRIVADNILGAHIDSPRIDVKQNPLYESEEFAYLDTHYYGGIKKYQWLTMPLAIHGVVAKTNGEVVDVCIGESEEDPVFAVTDLLPHLAAKQMEQKANAIIEGEKLDVIIGNRPLEGVSEDEKEAVKKNMLAILEERYGMTEEDFVSAELEIVPAGKSRDMGFDRSMVMGYGQDDRVCGFTSLFAMLDVEAGDRTTCCILVDKEEIGSVGATGMHSRFFENAVAEILALMGETADIKVRRALQNSKMLSSDVSAAYDPMFAEAFEKRSSAFFGKGLVFNKFTDLGATEQWNAKSALLYGICKRVTVSGILERTATEEQRSQGLDIADFFLFSPTKRQILQLMIQRNPALQLLIDELDLTLVE